MFDRKFVIMYAGEDGVRVSELLSEAELIKRITPDRSGESYYGRRRIATSYPKHGLSEHDGSNEEIVILEVKLTVPKQVETVIKYEI